MQIVHTYPEIRFNPLGPEQGSKAELQTQSPHVQQITFPVITCGTVVVFRQTDASLQIQIEPPVQFPCDVQVCPSHQMIRFQVIKVVVRRTPETGD